MKKYFWLLLILVVPVLYTALKPASTNNECRKNPKAPQQGVLRAPLGQEPPTLNPVKATDAYSSAALSWTHEGLMTRDLCTGEWLPALALKYFFDEKNLSYTFILREQVQFHNGSEMTAEDVKFSFDVLKNSPTNAASKAHLLKVIDRAEVVDRYQVRFFLVKKYFDAVNLLVDPLNLRIIPKAVYDGAKGLASKEVIGTGAYVLKEWRRGKFLSLERNKNWWADKVASFKGMRNFTQVLMRINNDPASYVQMVEKGDLDIASLTPEYYHTKAQGADWGKKYFAKHFKIKMSMGYSFLGLNLEQPLFADVKTRKAMAHLMNRKLMRDKFSYGSADLVAGPWLENDKVDSSVKQIEFDPTVAKKLLAEAGWRDSDKDGTLDKKFGKEKTSFKFKMIFANRLSERYLTIFQEDLKHAGIQMELQYVEWAAFLKLLDEKKFMAFALGWTGQSVEGDPYPIWHSASGGLGGHNFVGYKNPKADEIILKIQAEMDKAKRNALYKQLYKIIAEDVPYIFLLSDVNIYYAHSEKIQMPQDGYAYGTGLEYWWYK